MLFQKNNLLDALLIKAPVLMYVIIMFLLTISLHTLFG